MFGVNDFFFDIVFDLVINSETYDFNLDKSNILLANEIIYYEGKYNDSNQAKKITWKVAFIGLNGFILLGCIYTLIFILIPIIKFRILICSKKRQRRISQINDRLNSITPLRERLNSNPA